MDHHDTASIGGLPPMTISNLLAADQEGLALINEIWDCVNYDDEIDDFLSVRNLFWRFNEYKQDGYIYLLQAEGTRYFKIGKSISPDRRLRQIKPKMPFETQMVGAIRTNYMSLHERVLHWSWDSYRANGEWFLLSEDDEWSSQFISKMKNGFSQPLSTLESLVGGMIQGLVASRLVPWVRSNFDTDPHRTGVDSAFLNVASEIATLNAATGGRL